MKTISHLPNVEFHSQAGQDEWVLGVLKNKTNGFFVEAGAYDGVQTSNTYCLESSFGWNGICIEANPTVFTRLIENRRSINVHCALLDYKGQCLFGDDSVYTQPMHLVPCDTLDGVLKRHGAPKEIDYLSIDIEGAEFTVLEYFPFSEWDIKLITVEHNHYLHGSSEKDKLFSLLSQAGFLRVVEDAPCLDPHPSVFQKPYEDWYIGKKHVNLLS